MKIYVCRADEGGVQTEQIDVEEGATFGQAAALIKADAGWGFALWGARASDSEVLKEGDRIDVCAPLLVDPKEARRQRALRQGDVRQVTNGRHGGRHRLAV